MLSGNDLKKTLYSLKLINTLFGNHRRLGNAVVNYCKTNAIKRRIHIVDLGCGGGDCINYISKKLKTHSIRATFTGIDGNPTSISHALQNSDSVKNIDFITQNIIDKDFVIPDCEVMIRSHFVYYFNDNDLIDFF